jgi:hypothetical protein
MTECYKQRDHARRFMVLVPPWLSLNGSPLARAGRVYGQPKAHPCHAPVRKRQSNLVSLYFRVIEPKPILVAGEPVLTRSSAVGEIVAIGERHEVAVHFVNPNALVPVGNNNSLFLGIDIELYVVAELTEPELPIDAAIRSRLLNHHGHVREQSDNILA